MEFLTYLLLICVLAVLAGLMLFARFSGARARKSLHHAPVAVGTFSVAADGSGPISVALPGGVAGEPAAAVLEIRSDRPEATETPESLGQDSEPRLHIGTKQDVSASSKEVSSGQEGSSEKSYLDELQEAAAGLAMLMRSSPSVRTEPVLFEAEPEPEVETEPEIVSGFAEAAEEEARAESCDFLSGDETGGGVLLDSEVPAVNDFPASMEEETAPAEVSSAVEVSEVIEHAEEEGPRAPRSLAELLGEEVEQRFTALDEELDTLERTVDGIEASLRLLDDPVSEFVPEELAPDAEHGVSEAA